MNLRRHTRIKYLSHGREDKLADNISERVERLTEINKKHFMHISNADIIKSYDSALKKIQFIRSYTIKFDNEYKILTIEFSLHRTNDSWYIIEQSFKRKQT